MSRNSTGRVRRIGPTTRGTGVRLPLRLTISAGFSSSMPSSAVANRLE